MCDGSAVWNTLKLAANFGHEETGKHVVYTRKTFYHVKLGNL